MVIIDDDCFTRFGTVVIILIIILIYRYIHKSVDLCKLVKVYICTFVNIAFLAFSPDIL